MLGTWDVQQIAAALHDHQSITCSKCSGDVGRNLRHPVAAVDDQLPLDQFGELGHRSLCRGDLIAE